MYTIYSILYMRAEGCILCIVNCIYARGEIICKLLQSIFSLGGTNFLCLKKVKGKCLLDMSNEHADGDRPWIKNGGVVKKRRSTESKKKQESDPRVFAVLDG